MAEASAAVRSPCRRMGAPNSCWRLGGAGLGRRAGQQRGLVGVQLSSVHSEVGLGGGLDPGRPLAEVDIVEVFLEDGGAREFGGQLLAEKNLLDFVGERLV